MMKLMKEIPKRIMKFSIMRIKIKYVLLFALIVYFAYIFGVFTHIFEIDYHTKFRYPLDVDITVILEELKAGKKPTVRPINEYNYRFKIKNEDKCKTNEIRLLYVVKSAHGNNEQRNAIRNSWGWEKRFSDVTIRRIFMLGSSSEEPTLQDKIDEEQEKFNDIVQADFVDSYYNNTIKTMMAFKWIVNYCSRAQFVFFVDDDMYVSTKNLLAFIRSLSGSELRKLLYSLSYENFPREKLFLNSNNTRERTGRQILSETDYDRFDTRILSGYVFVSSPMRHQISKWYITLDEYPFSKYPPYVTAGAYLANNECVVDLYYTSLYTKHFKFDDVFLGIVAKKAGISPIHSDNFFFWKKEYSKESYNSVIASHGYKDPKELLRVWEEQRSLGYA